MGWAASCRAMSASISCNPSLTWVARSGARSCASMESERSSSQISRAGLGMGRLCWRRAGPESARITGRQASQRQGWPDSGSAADRPAWPGEQAGIAAAAPPLPQPGIRASNQRGRSKVSSMVASPSWPAYSWDGLCDRGCASGLASRSSSQARPVARVELLVGLGEDLGAGRGLQGVDGLVDGGGSPRLRARK